MALGEEVAISLLRREACYGFCFTRFDTTHVTV